MRRRLIEELMDGLPCARASAQNGLKLLFDFVDVLPLFHFAGKLALVGCLEQADPSDLAEVHADGVVDDVHVFELFDPLAVYIGLVGLFLIIVVVACAVAVFRCAIAPGEDDFRLAHPVTVFPGFACLNEVSGGYALRNAHHDIINAVAVQVSVHVLSCPQSVLLCPTVYPMVSNSSMAVALYILSGFGCPDAFVEAGDFFHQIPRRWRGGV